MPFSDRKAVQPDASDKAKTETYEICKNCGRLILFGSTCECGLNYQDQENLFQKFRRSED